MVVALLDDHTVPEVPATAPAATVAAVRMRRAAGDPRACAIAPARMATGVETAGRHQRAIRPLMGMRGKSWQLGWAGTRAQRSTPRSTPTNTQPPDIPPPPSGELKPIGQRHVHDRSRHGGAFSVKVDRDGTVQHQGQAERRRCPLHRPRHRRARRTSTTGRCARPASIRTRARSGSGSTRRATSASRIGASSTARSSSRRAPELMKRNIAWAWSKTAATIPTRASRRCSSCGTTAPRPATTTSSRPAPRAREYLVGYIRAHLPRHAGAYTPEDLARLNAAPPLAGHVRAVLMLQTRRAIGIRRLR